MTIIFGGGSKLKNPGGLWVPYLCRPCDGLSSFLVVENYKYGHVYGIRLAKYKAKYFLVCSRCDGAIPVESKERFQMAQAIARRVETDPDIASSTLAVVAEVARFVLGEPDLADALVAADNAPAEVPPQSAAAVSAAHEKVCPDCAEAVKAAARKCRFCGYQFEGGE